MSRPLHPDVALSIHLSAICSRNRYTRNPGPVIEELVSIAGMRNDLPAEEIGKWAGYYGDEHTAVLVAAIIADVPGAAAWVAEGRAQRDAPARGTIGSGLSGTLFAPR